MEMRSTGDNFAMPYDYTPVTQSKTQQSKWVLDLEAMHSKLSKEQKQKAELITEWLVKDEDRQLEMSSLSDMASQGTPPANVAPRPTLSRSLPQVNPVKFETLAAKKTQPANVKAFLIIVAVILLLMACFFAMLASQ